MGVLFSLGDGERPGLLLSFVCCHADSREAHLGSEDPASTCFTVSAWSRKQALGIFFNPEPVVSGFSGAQSRIHRRQTEQLEKLSLCNSTDCKVPHWSAFSLLFRVYLFALYIMS